LYVFSIVARRVSSALITFGVATFTVIALVICVTFRWLVVVGCSIAGGSDISPKGESSYLRHWARTLSKLPLFRSLFN